MIIDQIQIGQIEILKTLLQSNNEVQLRSRGNSMFPTIRSSDILIIRPTKKMGFTRGDVIVFQRGSQLVCHRITSILDDNHIETQGDSCLNSDGKIPKEKILGVVVRKKNSRTFIFKISKLIAIVSGKAYFLCCHFLLKLKFQKDKFQRK